MGGARRSAGAGAKHNMIACLRPTKYGRAREHGCEGIIGSGRCGVLMLFLFEKYVRGL